MEERSRRRQRRDNRSNSKQKILIASITALVILGVLFGTYYFTSSRSDSKYFSYINFQKENVDKVNVEVAKLASKIDELDYKNADEVNKLITSLSTNYDNIQKTLNELMAYNPNSKYSEQFDAFRKGVGFNAKILQQTILILRNPTKDTDNALKDLDTYLSETTKYYNMAKLRNFSISLPNEMLAISGNVTTYATKANNDYEAKKRLLEQYTEYISSMENIHKSFQTAMVDLSSNFDLILSGKRSMGDVYVDVDKKMTEINSIKNSYDSINVPSKFANQHKKFNTIIESYFNYCQEFKNTLTAIEETGNDKEKLDALGEDIDSIRIRYVEIKNSFDNYLNQFNSDKYYYQDINNL